MRRDIRLPVYVAGGMLLGLLLAFAVMFVLTRTQFGMERARRYAVAWLEERVQGELRIGRVAGPGLLRGVMIHDIEIIDPRGRLFLRIDSARVAYDWRTLVRGRVVLNQATAYQPVVNLERLPGDTLWNYQIVFPPGEEVTPDHTRSLILFQQGRIVNGTFTLRMPWQPDLPVAPEDTVRLILEDVPGGLVTAWRFEDIQAQLGRVLWESPLEDGQLFEIRSIATRGFLWRDPLLLRHARGTVTRRDTLLTFDMPEVELPASRATMLGSIIFGEMRNLYDVRIDSRRFLWRDLRWIYPPLPEQGGGSTVLHIQSQQPRGVLWHFRDARLLAPGTRLAGNFGIVAGDTLFFTDVDLRAQPLNLDLIEAVLPGALPVEGLLIGTIEVRGPLSSLDTQGDLRFATRAGEDGGSLRWRGTLDVAGGATGTQRLHADLSGVDLAIFPTRALPIDGRVSGSIDLSGRLDGDVRFDADLTHALAGRAASRLVGGGSYSGVGRHRHLDVLFHAEPLSLEEYLTNYPLISGLDVAIRGPVRVSGRADSLSFEAEVASTAGLVHLTGTIGGSGPARYRGEGRFTGFRADVVVPELPKTRVSGSFAFDLASAADGALDGVVGVDLDSVAVGALPIGRGGLRGTLSDGLLLVDSAQLVSAFAGVRGAGSFGVDRGREGTLAFDLWSDGLEPLEPLLFDRTEPDPTLPPRIAGRLRGSGSLSGSVSRFDLAVGAVLHDFVYDDAEAAAVELRFAGTSLRSTEPRARLELSGDSLVLLGHSLVRLLASAEHGDGVTRFASSAGSNGSDLFRAAGSVRRDEQQTLVGIDELRIGHESDAWALSRQAAIRIAGSTAYVDSLEFASGRGAGSVTAGGRLAWRGDDARGDDNLQPVDFDLAFAGVPLHEFLRLTRRSADASADVAGRLRITGTARAPVLEGELILERPRIADARLDDAAASFRYAERQLDAALHAHVGNRKVLHGEGTIPLDLSFTAGADRRPAEPLGFVFTAERLPAATLLGLLDGFTAVTGSLDGTLAVRGTTREPTLEGRVLVTDGGALWDATGVRYRDVTGTFSTVRDRVIEVDLAGRAVDPRVRNVTGLARAGAAGTGHVRGTLDFAIPYDPAFDLVIRADEVLAARRRDADVTVTGDATLRGRYGEPVVGGSVRVERGALHLDEIYRQYLVVDLDDALFFDAIDTTHFAVPDLPSNPFLRHLVVDNVRIAVGPGSWLRSRDMNVEVTGAVTVGFNRAREELRLIGSMQVLRGTYQLYYPPLVTRRFDVQQGTIDFPGTPGLDPALAIKAVYRAKSIHGDPLDITADVYGTIDAPRVRLSSNAQPPISESDLASYLFFGAPTNALAPNAAGGGFGFSDLGRRTFGPSALGYVASGLQTLAQSTGFIDYVGLSAAESMPGEPNAGLGSVFSDAQLEIGLYLAPEMFVAFTKRLNSSSADAGVRLEWRFHPTYTAELFAEDRFARTPSFGFTQVAGEARKIFGLWLFREWGY